MQTIVERQQDILARIRVMHSVKVGELSDQLGVTPETIRKDLVELDERGLIQRVHGGAVAKPNRETAYESRKSVQPEAKQAIANAALKLVDGAKTIYLDYGTTIYAFAQLLAFEDPEITVVTNSLPTVSALLPCHNVELVVPGGIVRKNENSLSGPLTETTMSTLFFDKGFFSCAGISVRAGVTNFHAVETSISRLAMEHSGSVVLMADNAKFDHTAANQTAVLSNIDDLVTDIAPSAEMTEYIQNADCHIHIANKDM